MAYSVNDVVKFVASNVQCRVLKAADIDGVERYYVAWWINNELRYEGWVWGMELTTI